MQDIWKLDTWRVVLVRDSREVCGFKGGPLCTYSSFPAQFNAVLMEYWASYGRSEVHLQTFSLLSRWPCSYVASILQCLEPDFSVVTTNTRRRKSILFWHFATLSTAHYWNECRHWYASLNNPSWRSSYTLLSYHGCRLFCALRCIPRRSTWSVSSHLLTYFTVYRMRYIMSSRMFRLSVTSLPCWRG